MLQTPSFIPTDWKTLVLFGLAQILASVAAGLVTLVLALVGRIGQKPAAEIHESRARATRELAEAEEVKIRATFDLGNEAVAMTRKLLRAQEIIFQLHEEIAGLKRENEQLRTHGLQLLDKHG